MSETSFCRSCCSVMPAFYITGNPKTKRKRVFCSKKCKNQWCKKSYRLKNEEKFKAKAREEITLCHRFGTSVLPVEIKKMWAMVHLGYIIVSCGRVARTNKSMFNIQRIFNKIKKGETYAAYI